MEEKSSKKLTCLIVEDEQPAQWVLSSYINQVEEFVLIGCAFDGMEAFKMLEMHQVDVLFLDINLPGLTGFDMLNTLPYQPLVVFTSGSAQHAYTSFNYNVVDYLLKPITKQQFDRAAERILTRAHYHEKSSNWGDFEQYTDVEIRVPGGNEAINPVMALYLQSYGNYVKIVFQDRTVTAISSMRKLLEVLPARLFVQIHKSYYVNRRHIQSYTHNEVVVNEKRLPVGISYRKAFLAMVEDKNDD